MATILELPTYSDERGDLSVIDKILPFEIKRVYYIYNTKEKDRGYHKHKKTTQFAIAVSGSCSIYILKNSKKIKYSLNSPKKGILINPEDFHWMKEFSQDCILLVLASHTYNSNDYIYEAEK